MFLGFQAVVPLALAIRQRAVPISSDRQKSFVNLNQSESPFPSRHGERERDRAPPLLFMTDHHRHYLAAPCEYFENRRANRSIIACPSCGAKTILGYTRASLEGELSFSQKKKTVTTCSARKRRKKRAFQRLGRARGGIESGLHNNPNGNGPLPSEHKRHFLQQEAPPEKALRTPVFSETRQNKHHRVQ